MLFKDNRALIDEKVFVISYRILSVVEETLDFFVVETFDGL